MGVRNGQMGGGMNDDDSEDNDEDGARRGRQASKSASLCRQAEEEKAKGVTVLTDAWSRDTKTKRAAKSSVAGGFLQCANSMRSKNRKPNNKLFILFNYYPK